MASSSSSSAIIDEERSDRDRIEEEGDDHDHDHEGGVANSSSACGCFFGIGSRLSRSRSFRSCRYLQLQPHRQNGDQLNQSWMMKKVKRLKEIIKAVAGRKWRSFINGIINKRPSLRFQFQYDPRSYALNFDEGIGEEGRRHSLRPPPSVSPTPIGLGIGMDRCQI